MNFGNAPIVLTFYLRQSLNGCLSAATAAIVTVLPEPTYLGNNVDPFYQTVCFGGIATINLDTTGRGSSQFFWSLDLGK